jgi:iron complex outermembrane recepter protein
MINNVSFQSRLSVSVMLLASVLVPVSVYAQAAPKPASADATELAEVLVTARKTSETLQTTPVAVTALSEEALTVHQILEIKSLQGAVPNLSIGGSGTGPTSLVYMAIRGEGQNSPNSASDAAVGIYVDGVYFARPLVGNLGLLDIGSAEILRGPQGTLFGRNTTGGALNITSNKPTGKFEGSAEVGLGNYSDKTGGFVLNMPIRGDELATRLSFRYHAHDAYYTSMVAGGVDPAKLNNDYASRFSLRWAPSSSSLVVNLTADYVGLSDTGTASQLMGVNAAAGGIAAYQGFTCLPPGVNILFAAMGCQDVSRYVLGTNGVKYGQYYGAFVPQHNTVTGICILSACGYNGASLRFNAGGPGMNVAFNKNRAFGTSLNVDADFGAVHLKSITGWRQSKTSNASDLDGTPVDIAAFISEYRQHQISQELQLSGTVGQFDLIGGVFYMNESGTEYSNSNILPLFGAAFFGAVTAYGVGGGGLNPTNFKATSKAAFVQTNYHFNDAVRATVGYRYTQDSRFINRHTQSDIYASFNGPRCNLGAITSPCDDPHNASFSYPAWTVGVDWQANENLFLYAKASKAFMAGGFNTRYVPPPVSSDFKPESNQDFEVGFKSEFLDHHLRVNLAYFAAKQTDVQRIVNAVSNGQLTQYATNAGDSRTNGPELEITALPWTGMELSLNYAHLNAHYVAGTFKELQNVGTAAAPNFVSVDRSGEPIPQAPKSTYGFGITQTVNLSAGKLSFHADYSHRDDLVYTWQTPSPQLPAATQAQFNRANELGTIPGYGLLGARIAMTFNHPNLEVAVQGTNLSDTQYYQQQFDSYTGLGTSINYLGNPRTVGATFKFRF